MRNYFPKKKLFFLLVASSVFLLGWILYTFLAVLQLNRAVAQRDGAAVARHCRTIHYTTKSFSALTFRTNPTLETVDALLALASELETATQVVSKLQSELSTGTADVRPLFSLVSTTQKELERILVHSNNCSLCKKLAPEFFTDETHQNLTALVAFTHLAEYLNTGSHRYLVILQNSDELRATGGFVGSYAIVTLHEGMLEPISIEDIYDADGQFTGFIPAPPGVQEYLSSDRGLRLPDANWDPHFPTSAKQILQFFAFGEKGSFEGVIAVSDGFLTDILQITGPVWLPDYQRSVTAENVTEVLRTDRENFFAGSIQKKHLLKQFTNQVLNAVAQKQIQPSVFLELIQKQLRTKTIMAYSQHQTTQEFIELLGADGALKTTALPRFLAFVESNVGINKANRKVARSLSLHRSGTTLTSTYRIENNNIPPQKTTIQSLLDTVDYVPTATAAAAHLGYGNYQRILFPANWKLEELLLNGIAITDSTETSVETQQGDTLTILGFFIPVPEQTTATITATFKLPQESSPLELELYKQPGTGSLPVWMPPTATTPFYADPALILEKNSVTILP